jgi:enoyl-CoA hydratase/carnithine racemase
MGLVARVVPAADLEEAAAETAAALAAGAPVAQRFAKTALDRSFGMSFEEALELESQSQSICLGSRDVVEGITAFLEKRDPEFQGE